MAESSAEVDINLRSKYPDIFAEKQIDRTPRDIVETVICVNCQKPYEKTTFLRMGIKLEFSGGRCPKCRDIFLANEAAKSEIARQKAIRRQRKAWWLSSGVSQEYLSKCFETFKKDRQPKAYSVCVSYANNYPLNTKDKYPSLILYSEKSWGTGKTHLAGSIARRIIEHWNGEGSSWDEIEFIFECKRRNPVYLISEPCLFDSIKATFNYTKSEEDTRPTEEQIMNKIISVPLLILDDMGKEQVADSRFVQRTLFRIIDGRYKKGLPVVVTANLNKDGLAAHLGGDSGNEASFSRLLGMAKGIMYQMEGADYRQEDCK